MHRRDAKMGWADFYRYGDGSYYLDDDPAADNAPTGSDAAVASADSLDGCGGPKGPASASAPSPRVTKDAPRNVEKDIDIDDQVEYAGQQRRAHDLAALGDALFPLAVLCADAVVASCLGDPARALAACAHSGALGVAARVAARWRLAPDDVWTDGEGDAYEAMRVAIGAGDAAFVELLKSKFGSPRPCAIRELELPFANSFLRAAVTSKKRELVDYVLSVYPVLGEFRRIAVQAFFGACGTKDCGMMKYLCSRACCATGSLEVVQWLTTSYPLTPSDARTFNNEALRMCCKAGHLEIAEWLCITYGLTKADVMDVNFEILCHCCHNASLGLLQWLVNKFSISHDDVTVQDNRPLHDACSSGDLSFVQLFARQFSLTSSDIRSKANYALWSCCVSGHLDIAIWLTKEYSLTADDLRATTFPLTCCNGHKDCVQWLTKTFGPFPLEAIQNALNMSTEHGNGDVVEFILNEYPSQNILTPKALRSMCESGLLDTFQRLVSRYSLTPDSPLVSEWIHNVFSQCCSKGRIETVRWLVDEFGAREPESDGTLLYCMRNAATAGNIDLAKWFAGHFPKFLAQCTNPQEIVATCRECCRTGQSQVVEWLLSGTQELQPNEVENLIFTALYGGHIGLASWLIDKYHIKVFTKLTTTVLPALCQQSRLRTAKWYCQKFGVYSSRPHFDWDSMYMSYDKNKYMVFWLKQKFGAIPVSVQRYLATCQATEKAERKPPPPPNKCNVM
ncbi:hypothetical protein Pelo_7009 [Pelomyxa schiedti]|nr:hypothetical protein Pelo_7009 [Pelomyxa schiedti]